MGARPGARYFHVKVVWVLITEEAPGDVSVAAFRTKSIADAQERIALDRGVRVWLFRREFWEDNHDG
jgi:hypothetical protein